MTRPVSRLRTSQVRFTLISSGLVWITPGGEDFISVAEGRRERGNREPSGTTRTCGGRCEAAGGTPSRAGARRWSDTALPPGTRRGQTGAERKVGRSALAGPAKGNRPRCWRPGLWLEIGRRGFGDFFIFLGLIRLDWIGLTWMGFEPV